MRSVLAGLELRPVVTFESKCVAGPEPQLEIRDEIVAQGSVEPAHPGESDSVQFLRLVTRLRLITGRVTPRRVSPPPIQRRSQSCSRAVDRDASASTIGHDGGYPFAPFCNHRNAFPTVQRSTSIRRPISDRFNPSSWRCLALQRQFAGKPKALRSRGWTHRGAWQRWFEFFAFASTRFFVFAAHPGGFSRLRLRPWESHLRFDRARRAAPRQDERAALRGIDIHVPKTDPIVTIDLALGTY